MPRSCLRFSFSWVVIPEVPKLSLWITTRLKPTTVIFVLDFNCDDCPCCDSTSVVLVNARHNNVRRLRDRIRSCLNRRRYEETRRSVVIAFSIANHSSPQKISGARTGLATNSTNQHESKSEQSNSCKFVRFVANIDPAAHTHRFEGNVPIARTVGFSESARKLSWWPNCSNCRLRCNPWFPGLL